MKIVIDTNILFSYFWEKSITKKIINSNYLKLYSPVFALSEIEKYKKEIIIKTKITNKKYNEILKDLKQKIKFIDTKSYSKEFKKIKSIPDLNDIDFIALALSFDKVLWSCDKKLKNQNYVIVLNTSEILTIFTKIKL